MPVYKVTYFMRYGTFGASFSLLRTSGAIIDNVNPARNLRSVFGQLLGVGVELPYYRISDVAIKRDSLYQEEPAIVIGNTTSSGSPNSWVQIKAAQDDPPDFGNVAILIDLFVSAVSKGRVFLRLVPDSLVKYPGGMDISGNWDKAFTRFQKLLKADSWQVSTAASTAVNPQYDIVDLDFVVLGGLLTVTTLVNHTFAPGDTVRIGRTKNTSGVNGTYKVSTTPAANQFVVRLTSTPSLGDQPSGYAREITPAVQNIDTANIKGVSARKCGRPFGASVGRRSV